MTEVDDTVGAFVSGVKLRIDGQPDGPLSETTFAAKDLFDVAGYPTGGGNRDWAQQNIVPTRHAVIVERLLEAGGSLIGKTVTDEVSVGVFGETAFDGTPVNTAAPNRVPGGSSAGSAAAVAAGLCDFALGTDTGGSVRIPASFCGLYGIRPTHGRLDLTGMMSHAPTSDTAGWFARDATIFSRVASVLLQEKIPETLPLRLLYAADTFAFADPEVARALNPLVKRLEALTENHEEVLLAPQGLSVWARAQRSIQSHEAWSTFREWIERYDPHVAYSVSRWLIAGAQVSAPDLQWANIMRLEARARLTHLLPRGTVLCMPTTPFPAIPRGLPLPKQAVPRDRITCLTCLGGLAGVPQISIPGGMVDGLPVGLSVVTRAGDDALLVAVANAMEASI